MILTIDSKFSLLITVFIFKKFQFQYFCIFLKTLSKLINPFVLFIISCFSQSIIGIEIIN